MGSVTLSPSGGTWLNKSQPSADNSGQYYLYTSKLFYDYDQGSESARARAAVLRFTRPNAIKYKKITRATLETVLVAKPAGGVGTKLYWCPYKTDAALSAINFGNYKTAGEKGEWNSITIQPVYSSAEEHYLITLDLTGVFASNIKNDVFNIIIAGGGAPDYEYFYVPNSAGSDYLTIEYEDAPQLPPTPTYPKDVTLLESNSTLFTWQFNSDTEATQAGVTLAYKLQSAGSFTEIALTQTGHSYTLNQTLAPGAYEWKIKATNDIGETSAYSDVALFNIVGKPAAPVINTPDNKTLTTISWQTSDQTACDIELQDASGKSLVREMFATTVTSYKPNMFLKGTYTFSVRTKNSSGMWSDWASIGFTINAAGPTAATMNAIPMDDRVRVEFVTTSAAAIVRVEDGNEKVLALVSPTDTVYEDLTVKAGVPYTYIVRAYVNGYTDSVPRSVTVNYEGAFIADLHLNTSQNKFPRHSGSIERGMAVMKFSGREYPMIERGEFTDYQLTKEFFVTPEQRLRLEELAKEKTVYYRDNRGNAFEVAIQRLTYEAWMNEGYNVNISMIRTAEEEVVVNV